MIVSSAAELVPHAPSLAVSGAPDGDAPSPAGARDPSARLRKVQRALRLGPPVLLAATTVVCSWVSQHPAVVLSLMLGFPALLVVREQVEQRLRSAGSPARTATPVAIASGIEQTRESVTDQSAPAVQDRRSLPRGMQRVAEVAGSGSAPAAA